MKEFTVDKLTVRIFGTREEMGNAASRAAADCVKENLKKKETLNILFAAAPSQNEFLEGLVADHSIPWERINAFHMDEYIGLEETHPAGFHNFLDRHIFKQVRFKSINYLNGNAPNIEEEIQRYTNLLNAAPLDLCFMGVGENGHVAFNDPPVADFDDRATVKSVELEERCRIQQVHDGCFHTLSEVPKRALTVTVPGIMRANEIYCMVPASTKADAVCAMLKGPIGTQCPASILRMHAKATLYLDMDSSAKL